MLDVLSTTPGVTSARRLKATPIALGAPGAPYIALYEIETDDLGAFMAEMGKRSADGSITRVERQDLHTENAVARLTSMVSALENLDQPPEGVFVVGSGLSVSALKLQLESATSLPVSAPDEAGVALARGAALASARAPKFEAATIAAGHSPDDDGTTAGAVALAYSDMGPDPDDLALADEPIAVEPMALETLAPPVRKPFLLVGSAMTALFVVGVAALVISLAVSSRLPRVSRIRRQRAARLGSTAS